MPHHLGALSCGRIPMRDLVKANAAAVPFVVGTLLFLSALTFYYFAVLRIDYTKTPLLDLAPHPDATEYFAQAKALHMNGWPSIQIGYEKLPSRYPFGYPALMLPWLKILPSADDVLAPFRTSQTMGLLLLLAVFGFYLYLAMPLTGGFAVLLLSTLPGFFTFCRSSLSELSASLLIALAFMFAYLGFKQQDRRKIYLAAVFLGLSVNVRFQSIFFAPLLVVMALMPVKGMRGRWLLHCVAVCIIFVAAAGPILVFNTIQFHSPLKTGYDFWAPYFSMKHLLFLPSHVPRNALNLWRQFSLQTHAYDPAYVFGTGTCFVPAFMLLVGIGLVFVRCSSFFACACLAGLSSLTASLCYMFGHDGRFYLPVLILLVALAVLPVTWAAKNVFTRKWAGAALVVFVLLASSCLGYPSRSGYNTPGINRFQAWDALHFISPPTGSTEFLAERQFAQQLGSQSGLVLSDIDSAYLNALLPRSVVAAPIDGKHHYKWSYIWRYDRPQALALVEYGLKHSIPVYALFVSHDQAAKEQSRLPIIAGHEWHVLNNSSAGAAILQLTAAEQGAAESAPE
jgi:hypothetical protein